MERTIRRNEQAYKNLELVAKWLETFSKNGYKYSVEDVYFDFGQDWMWTTIICESADSSWQVLNPRVWEKIVNAVQPEGTTACAEAITEAIAEITSGEYFLDK